MARAIRHIIPDFPHHAIQRGNNRQEIFLKRLQGKKLTKTEREYFYRVVKKKAMALANSDLQRLAQQVVR